MSNRGGLLVHSILFKYANRFQGFRGVPIFGIKRERFA
jgi:hypothetical protein